MAQITVVLPHTMSSGGELTLEAPDYQQLFRQIGIVDRRVFTILFRETDLEIRPKPYVAMFVNDEQIFDAQRTLQNGDRIVFATAIAGG